MKVIIVGAVAGGATVASQLRRINPNIEITIYEKDRDMSFANCGLPYYLGNVIEDRYSLVQSNPQQFLENKNITVHTYHEVINIDTIKQTVTIHDNKNKQDIIDSYDYLILSPGAKVVTLPQLNASHVFSLRNLEDTDKIEAYIKNEKVQSVLVVGAGYISLEMVENLKLRGLDVTLVHRNQDLFKNADKAIRKNIAPLLKENGVQVLLDDEVKQLDGKKVIFKSGKTASYDMIISAIGIQPNTAFLPKQIALTDSKHIKVNPFFQTNVQNIYALGDAVELSYAHVDLKTPLALAWPAHRAASLIAKNIDRDTKNQQPVPFVGIVGASILKLFDQTFASVGIQEKDLNQFDVVTIEQTQKSNAGYMPNAQPMTLIVHFEKSSRKLLRASACGAHGVDKRIDILSTLMKKSATVDDLMDVEIAYSPPYASPKDIINMIGYKAQTY